MISVPVFKELSKNIILTLHGLKELNRKLLSYSMTWNIVDFLIFNYFLVKSIPQENCMLTSFPPSSLSYHHRYHSKVMRLAGTLLSGQYCLDASCMWWHHSMAEDCVPARNLYILPCIGSVNWKVSGWSGLSPRITIQPTTDVIFVGFDLNWKPKQFLFIFRSVMNNIFKGKTMSMVTYIGSLGSTKTLWRIK